MLRQSNIQPLLPDVYGHAHSFVLLKLIKTLKSNKADPVFFLTHSNRIIWLMYTGIAFLRGFQVTLQALGGSQVLCQLFLLGTNLSLTPAHAQRVYHSDPFTHLSLDSEYVVTVMALPIPEQWDQFYQRKQFFTRTCPEKNGLEKCKKGECRSYTCILGFCCAWHIGIRCVHSCIFFQSF